MVCTGNFCTKLETVDFQRVRLQGVHILCTPEWNPSQAKNVNKFIGLRWLGRQDPDAERNFPKFFNNLGGVCDQLGDDCGPMLGVGQWFSLAGASRRGIERLLAIACRSSATKDVGYTSMLPGGECRTSFVVRVSMGAMIWYNHAVLPNFLSLGSGEHRGRSSH